MSSASGAWSTAHVPGLYRFCARCVPVGGQLDTSSRTARDHTAQEITMNHIKTTVAAVVTAAALSLVAACGDVEAPANDIGTSVEKKSPAPEMPVRDHTGRMDFGD